jgi:uncharacterized membrane protein YgcG
VHIGWLDRYRVGSVYDDVDSVVFVLMCLVVALFFLVNAGELRFFVLRCKNEKKKGIQHGSSGHSHTGSFSYGTVWPGGTTKL